MASSRPSLKIARGRAEFAGVAERCSFELGDFLTYPLPEPFDYAIVMGFMDYVHDPRAIIERVLDIVRVRAFFSFPKAGGSTWALGDVDFNANVDPNDYFYVDSNFKKTGL